MSEYKIITFWSEKDAGYIGTCPEFDGIAVWGKTRQEAMDEAEAAVEAFIDIYQRDGLPLPKPTPTAEYSGQVRLRISRYIHQKAAELAEAEGLSLNAFLSGAVEARVGVQQYQQMLLDEITRQWMAATVNVIQNQISISAQTNLYFGKEQLPPLVPQEAVWAIGGVPK